MRVFGTNTKKHDAVRNAGRCGADSRREYTGVCLCLHTRIYIFYFQNESAGENLRNDESRICFTHVSCIIGEAVVQVIPMVAADGVKRASVQ